MPVHQTDQRLILAHPNGASAEVLLYGATVISWKTGTRTNPEPVEKLFVSSKAVLDGSKPVRGGIPIVFPCFGAPSHAEHARLSQHGFARSQVWTVESADESGVSVRLRLEPTESIKAVYERAFELVYVVTLGEHTLSTELRVMNTSENPLEFQAVFHNYIRAPADEVLVSPLQNKTYYDKTETSEEGRKRAKTETRAGVDVHNYTDSVYEDGGGRYEVSWLGGGIAIEATGLKDVVVWNPRREVKMSDMEEDGWERFVCVEPGQARGYAVAGDWVGLQVLSAI